MNDATIAKTRRIRFGVPAAIGLWAVVGVSVTFEPGARTAWHTHPLGQTLIVTAGVGRVQRWGGPVEEIRPAGSPQRGTESEVVNGNQSVRREPRVSGVSPCRLHSAR
jgi:hypothetical protein